MHIIIVGLISFAAAIFGFVSLFVAWKRKDGKATLDKDLLKIAAAINLVVFIINLLLFNFVNVENYMLFALVNGFIALVVFLASSLKLDDKNEELILFLLWSARVFSSIPMVGVVAVMPGVVLDLRDRVRMGARVAGVAGGMAGVAGMAAAGQYELVPRADAAERANVHRQYERLHPSLTPLNVFWMNYYRQPKTSEEWRIELGYPFNPDPRSPYHTPQTLLNASRETQSTAILNGLRTILTSDTETNYDQTFRILARGFGNARFATLSRNRAKEALQALMFIYNEDDIKVDWARAVVEDSRNAYGQDSPSCANGTAEAMVIQFFQTVNSNCMSRILRRSSKMRSLCAALEIQVRRPTATIQDLYHYLARWREFEDDHYAEKDPRTRRAELIRFLANAVSGEDLVPSEQERLEGEIARILSENNMIDTRGGIDFEANNKDDAVVNIGNPNDAVLQ